MLRSSGFWIQRVLVSMFTLGAVFAFGFASLIPAVATPGPTLGRDLPASACHGGGKAPVSENPPTLTILAAATGTVRSMPEFGILERAPVGDDIQSTYFRTTAQNREFRRGFAEFLIPEIPGHVVSATLVIAEGGGWVSAPRDPDRHALSYYLADLSVDVADYDRPARLLGCFDTDQNLEHERFAFDVRHLVRTYQGGDLGFRIRLLVDPTYASMDSLGADFQTNHQADPVRIEIVTAG